MTYYDNLDILKKYVNQGKKIDPSKLISEDWEYKQISSGYVRVFSKNLDIELKIKQAIFHENNRFQEGIFQTWTSIGFVSQDEFYEAEDMIETYKETQIKEKDIKHLGIYEDVSGDIFMIFKKDLNIRSSRREMDFKISIQDTFINVYGVALNKNFEPIGRSLSIYFDRIKLKKAYLTQREIEKKFKVKEVEISDKKRSSILKNIFKSSFLTEGNILLSFYTDESFVEGCSWRAPDNTDVYELIEVDKSFNGRLYYICHKEDYIKGSFKEGDFYYNYVSYQKIPDINKLKEVLNNTFDFTFDRLMKDQPYFEGDMKEYIKIPMIFMGI